MLSLILATVICWLNFVIIDTLLGLPEKPGVSGADTIGKKIESIGGNIHGGYFMGNIVCSPDASAGTLLGSIMTYLMGVDGGLIASLMVWIGNRLCSDPGYAGTLGALSITLIITILKPIIEPKYFIAGTALAIFTIQGLEHRRASWLLYRIAKLFKVVK
ncbi:membrane protein-like protein [Methanocaldococcus infernus ME]|uniref:Membrane protein-like protein n=1 Tax=Methanocaldococcus infernus (strain DSM 11812 / JCM 15783 / ME) TaxID=573063 RepID=D5VTQ5_METIM|nr:membrane protein-like protein [Methanocaldococcus infernus ME]